MTAFPKKHLLVLLLGMLAWVGRGYSQDTIFLKGDTIRVGELEWDIEKDWRSRKDLISSNLELYGEHVRIKLSYHPNKMVEQMQFGYVSEDSGFVPHGPSRLYYPQGQLLGKRYYRSGVLDGPAVDYFPGGAVKVKCRYQDGVLHGSYATFYENGETELVAHYEKGLPNGIHRSWYSNGARKWVETYDLGRRTGPDSSFYETGTLESTAAYVEGLPEGEWMFFHRNGSPWTERVYEAGLLMRVSFLLSKEGRPLEVGDFMDGNGWIWVYNDDGLQIEREKYRKGKLKKVKPLN